MTLNLILVELQFYLCFHFLLLGVGTEALEESFCVSLRTQPLPVHRIKTYTIREGILKAVM